MTRKRKGEARLGKVEDAIPTHSSPSKLRITDVQIAEPGRAQRPLAERDDVLLSLTATKLLIVQENKSVAERSMWPVATNFLGSPPAQGNRYWSRSMSSGLM